MKKLLISLMLAAGCLASQAQDSVKMPLDSVSIKLNSRCPMNFNDGMTLQNVTAADGKLVFYYIISDDLYANVENLAGILHDSIVAELLSSPDPDIKKMISVCTNTNTDIIHRYSNSQKKSFDIIIKSEDLE